MAHYAEAAVILETGRPSTEYAVAKAGRKLP